MGKCNKLSIKSLYYGTITNNVPEYFSRINVFVFYTPENMVSRGVFLLYRKLTYIHFTQITDPFELNLAPFEKV